VATVTVGPSSIELPDLYPFLDRAFARDPLPESEAGWWMYVDGTNLR
jgi:hypothetical protein